MAERAELVIESKEKVAFDMANRIAHVTFKSGEADYKERYLDLYDECLKAVEGRRNRKASSAPSFG